jgi:hypothetical protein
MYLPTLLQVRLELDHQSLFIGVIQWCPLPPIQKPATATTALWRAVAHNQSSKRTLLNHPRATDIQTQVNLTVLVMVMLACIFLTATDHLGIKSTDRK